ncbi:MAG: hypothetical protein JOZ31_26380 [Verrucomicrobia bacterium]|nr:hypothetical protein [Verrucomicrobiota bacterium]MBV8485610.1 hypothetical protein [Verrucomicrobiota bacterium]
MILLSIEVYWTIVLVVVDYVSQQALYASVHWLEPESFPMRTACDLRRRVRSSAHRILFLISGRLYWLRQQQVTIPKRVSIYLS